MSLRDLYEKMFKRIVIIRFNWHLHFFRIIYIFRISWIKLDLCSTNKQKKTE